MTRRAWALAILGVILCSMFAGAARASVVNPTGGAGLNYGGSSLTFGDGMLFDRFMTRTVGGTTSPAGVALSETYRLPLGGASVDVAAARTVPWGAIAGTAALLGGAFWSGFQLGAPIAKALGHDQFSIGPVGCTAQSGGWVCDPLEAPHEEEQVTFNFNAFGTTFSGTGSSPGAAVSDWVTKNSFTGAVFGTKYRVVSGGCGGYTPPNYSAICHVMEENNTCDGQGGNCTGWTQTREGDFVASGSVQTMPTCSATIDALNPAWSTPKGPPTIDGKCPTGRYNAVSVDDMVEKLTERGVKTAAKPLFDDLMAKGQPVPGASERTMTGPATKTLPTTTTTTSTPTGDKVKTTTGTITYNYAGDTITYNITTTTTTVNPDGTVETETDQTEEPEDPCAKDPDRLGCVKLGEPSDDKPKWTEKPVTYAPVAMPGGSCPPDRNITFHGWLLPIKYAPACDAAPAVRVGMLLCATLMAAGLIIRTVTA